jgi:hypothetical protein
MYLEKLYNNDIPLELQILKDRDVKSYNILNSLFEIEEDLIDEIIEEVDSFNDVLELAVDPFTTSDIEDLKDYVDDMIYSIENELQIDINSTKDTKNVNDLLLIYKKIKNIIKNL